MRPEEEQNPFLSPMVDARDLSESDSDAARIRRAHISHEASIKSMGFLYYIGAVIGGLYFVVMMAGLFIALLTSGAPADPLGVLTLAGLTAFLGGMAYLNYWVGRGLRGLDPRVRTAAIVLSAIGLLGIPIGTLISAYFLWLLLSKKGVYVFSDEYHDIIAQTPHIKYKTSIVVWIFLGLLLIVLGLAIVAALVGSVVG